MKKALVVGINYYDSGSLLHGCVNDAHNVKSVLERNADGTVNFGVKLMTASGSTERIERGALRDAVKDLFSGDPDVALFYFAGHGYIEATGGYLCTSEVQRGDDGLSLSDIIAFANQSECKNKIIVLDSCHSGIAGASTNNIQSSELSNGLTILTASTDKQYASEKYGSGVFTTLFVDALNGAASNLVGDVTPGGVYAHIDQSLGPWEQRPVFKTNVKSFVSLRKVHPPVPLADLRRLAEFFPSPGFEFKLDPSYEPESQAPDQAHVAVFSVLQKFNRVNLLVPVNAPHMYHAAMESKSCKLTVLGEHYRRLVQDNMI